ncbi:MAG TPA: hypothetical protein VHT34_11320, partial [Clostridia bacterium]|nr:hypothetical protein [Clostridia bacterium]
MKLQFNNKNLRFYSFTIILALCIALISIVTQDNAFGLSSGKQTVKKTTTILKNDNKSSVKT